MSFKNILLFILGFILSGGLFTVLVYVTDLLNDRLVLYIGTIIISMLAFLVQRKKIKPLTYGFFVGCIPIVIIIVGFIVISSLH